MTQVKDDLEAVREISKILEPFNNEERTRIFRWVSEKLNMPESPVHRSVNPQTTLVSNQLDGQSLSFRDFYNEKLPTNDTYFAATVAYYYQFIAPSSEKKHSINKDDLQNAARLAPRERFKDPGNTLNNAVKTGYLDNTEEPGMFKINTVGENLVSMTLPAPAKRAPKKKQKKSPNK